MAVDSEYLPPRTVGDLIYRVAAWATEAPCTSLPPHEAAELLGRIGMAVVMGDLPNMLCLAIAEGYVPGILKNESPADIRAFAKTMRAVPGAFRSKMPIDFPGLGRRYATLVPMQFEDRECLPA